MLNVTCTFCRAPINLSDGELALIVAEVERDDQGKKPKSHLITCYSCRRGNKVPWQRIEQAYRLAGSPPPPEVTEATSSEGNEEEAAAPDEA